MRIAAETRGPIGLALVLGGLGSLAAAFVITASATGHAGEAYDIGRMLLFYATLPRMATALLCGAALALSGAVFQQVLRNPLASPTTLGVSAGGGLALALAMLFAPALLGFGRDLVTLAGSAAAAGLVLAIGARQNFSPFSLVIAGLIVGLWCGALSAVLVLLNDRYLAGLFIWGAGSLAQQSWSVPAWLAAKLAVLGGLSALLIRPLALIELGDEGARALGINIHLLRVVAIAVAVGLAAIVTSAVGVIGFVGLVAPTLARLTGARRPSQILIWSSVIGAALLFLTDNAVMMLSTGDIGLVPTGAVTAVFGAPLLIALLPRLKTRHRRPETTMAGAPNHGHIRLRLAIAAALALAAACLAIFVGRTGTGDFALLGPDLLASVGGLRAPRVMVAFLAGAMLSLAGVILQRLTGNEMASPEILGIGAGATLGVTAGVLIFASLSLVGQFAVAALGAMAVIAVIFLLAVRSGLAPERVLLGGIALTALADAVIGFLAASGDPRALFLMRWLSGSTYNAGFPLAGLAALTLAVLLPAALMTRRWLAVLPLGEAVASARGVPVARARSLLLLLAGILSAAATLCVGPLTFVGLMAPHAARLLGFRRPAETLLAAALLGGGLMTLADWAGRTAIFPYEIPAGLAASLLGAPFLVLLMRGRKA
ncbi:Fe(3+)-hydroxamate ABC transporter permease FhuB [Martelella endophytica]|uniref:Iron ABC transporter n=1 Tax=Martelella endophytica TaxID=1486262 RepID=A0A0D5LN06_MAREN|nr:Fe(3+)-hydroxamate ABC transporter permease FhuB [Martelella endophytica]AJY45511.1 iron ABC transporter [Martelella endophytica]